MRDMYTELKAPILGTHDGLPVVIVGAFLSATSLLQFVAIETDGSFVADGYDAFIADVRFSDSGEWIDVSPGPDDAEE